MDATQSTRTRLRLHAELEDLATTRRELDNAAVAHAQAVAGLQAVQAELDATAFELERQRARVDASTRTISILRSTLRTLETFPPELLLAIFVEAAADHRNGSSWHVVDLDEAAIKIPYRLAAVCCHWRQTALCTPALWTRVQIPTPNDSIVESVEGLSRYLRLHLSLSRHAPIDISWDLALKRTDGDSATLEKNHMLEDSSLESLFAVIDPHAWRIRSLIVRTRALTFINMKKRRAVSLRTRLISLLIDLLRCPTPNLVEVAVRCTHRDRIEDEGFWQDFPQRQFPLLLPDAPQLRRLHIVDVPLFMRQGHPGLPALRSLSIEMSCSSRESELFSHTVSAAPQLDALSLNFAFPQAPSDLMVDSLPISCLELVGDALTEFANYARLSMPRLSSISLDAYILDNFTVTDAMTGSVVTLTILGDCIHFARCAVLQRFKAVEYVTIGLDGSDETDDDFLFSRLCDEAAPMWPRLCHLVLTGIENSSVDCDGVLRLVRVRARHGAANATEHTAGVQPLERVEFDQVSVPPHVAVQVKEIMGDRCTIL
ncbi:hypothetical protein EXIGLDRAFT_727495 [Exidia glandulosa HHB12029]|uniref:Uncharacterized protein n=1 Tax=Exidia glandulosa HHB12029 TaxID=1314781 RepID=A0A165DCH8_EXIGL|nr:hypothetical protein EXIGLDRAFT_727495 [Exidia glandulosa HHB12029]